MSRARTIGCLLLTASPAIGAAAPRAPRDRYGDPLPPGALARLGSVRLRGPGWVNVLAVSPDGRKAYSAHNGDTVCALDRATGRRLHTWAVRPGLDELRWLADLLPAGCVRPFTLGVPDNPGVALADVLGHCRWL